MEQYDTPRLDPESCNALYEEEPGELDVTVQYLDYEWHRRKSNENVRDPRDGKGCSFYIAPLAFEDPDHIAVPAADQENSAIVSQIFEDTLTLVVYQLLGNKKRIVTVYNTEKYDEQYYVAFKRKHMKEYLNNTSERMNTIRARVRTIDKHTGSWKETHLWRPSDDFISPQAMKGWILSESWQSDSRKDKAIYDVAEFLGKTAFVHDGMTIEEAYDVLDLANVHD